MSKHILQRVWIAFIIFILLPNSFYFILKGFHDARYYQRYLEAPKYAWNQMKTIELAQLPSNAAVESNLNSKIIDWSVNQENITWIIKLFRFKELAKKEQANFPLLCELQSYRHKHPMIGDYFDSIFSQNSDIGVAELTTLKNRYITSLQAHWQKVLNLNCVN